MPPTGCSSRRTASSSSLLVRARRGVRGAGRRLGGCLPGQRRGDPARRAPAVTRPPCPRRCCWSSPPCTSTAGGCFTGVPPGPTVRLADADADAHEQYVRLSRKIERREHERLLHDTVLNTLTAMARRAAAAPAVVGRCRQDVTLLEHALPLGDPGDPAKAAGRAYGGLVAAIEAVAVEMRARGLDVHAPARVRRAQDRMRRLSRCQSPWPSCMPPGRRWRTWPPRRDRRGLGQGQPGGAGRGHRGRPAASGSPCVTRVPVSIPPASIRPGWACAGRSPSGSPTGAAGCRYGRRRATAPW